MPSSIFWQNKRVLLTGHTGFKGSWTSHLLENLGAEVHGFSIDIPTTPSLFEVSDVASKLASDTRADICSEEAVASVFNKVRPEIVLHLAAQSLVLTGYSDPAGTFRTNVVGTLNVLDAIRTTASVKAAVMVTTDKVYKNLEWVFPYREIDSLGGSDPYSASKSAAEMVVTGYQSLTQRIDGPVAVSARAGNVIGGGDWSPGRLLPDLIKVMESGSTLVVRNPTATRPWQHVLDPVAGYLLLAELVYENTSSKFPRSWNFGPSVSSVQSVNFVIDTVAQIAGKQIDSQAPKESQPSEHQLLALDSTQAHHLLSWTPKLAFKESLRWTLKWHEALGADVNMREFTEQQIDQYLELGLSQ